MHTDCPGLTGFFKEGQKRIDLVLVLKDTSRNEIDEVRLNFLMTAIKFGFELELDEGTLPDHRNLIFVKVHAPDDIIEEYGVYFHERKFFKGIHVDYINPVFNPLDMKHERELIKITREKILGRPSNYSTLERSMIVYKIFLHLPFGEYENQFGVNKLMRNNIVLDVYALHDGPYFIPSGQSKSCVNARQTLFYNWLGMVNIWKTQPVHTVQEYLGIRVAFYFAYYQYFNWMLILPAIYGLWIALGHMTGGSRFSYLLLDEVCDPEFIYPHDMYYYKHYGYSVYKYRFLESHMICPQCRHFKICPFRLLTEYCKELSFINRIDTNDTFNFAIFVSIWGMALAIIWRHKKYYLDWMWEINEQYVKKIIKPEYGGGQSVYTSHLTGITLTREPFFNIFKRLMLVLVSAGFLGAWVFFLFILSIYIWYIKHWMRFGIEPIEQNSMFSKYHEHLYIGMGAAIYSIVVTVLKILTRGMSYALTALADHKTIESYGDSLALKLYAFSISGSVALLTFHTFVGHYSTDMLYMNRWYTIGGYGVMNNGLGTSFDDICVTLAVIVVVEQIIFKIPAYFYKKWSDYEGVYNSSSTPCWEREYKLETLNENFFHDGYNAIAEQFALATLFSLAFPAAPLLLLAGNLWDARHRARRVLLACRRPLLLYAAGPGVWHTLVYVTAFAVPIFNCFVIAYQSMYLYQKYATVQTYMTLDVKHSNSQYYLMESKWFQKFKGAGSPAEEYDRMKIYEFSFMYKDKKHGCLLDAHRTGLPDGGKLPFMTSELFSAVLAYRYRFLVFFSAVAIFVHVLLHFLLPTKSRDIEEAVRIERKIKRKYYIQKGYLPNEHF